MLKDGIGIFLWKLAVALYLIANGVLGLSGSGDYQTILTGTMRLPSVIATIVAVLSIIAGVFVLLEMLGISMPDIVNKAVLCIAIIWAIYIIIGLISWFTGKGGNLWEMLQRLGVHTMVLGSLLIAGRFQK